MLPPVGSVGSYLRLDGPSRQRLHVHRLVLEPVALLVPERVLEPVRIVAAVIVGAVVRASRRASADTIEARATSIRLSSSRASTRAVLNTRLLSLIWVREARSASSCIFFTPLTSISGKRKTPQ